MDVRPVDSCIIPPRRTSLKWPGLTLVGHGHSRKEPGGKGYLRGVQVLVSLEVCAFRPFISHHRWIDATNLIYTCVLCNCSTPIFSSHLTRSWTRGASHRRQSA